MKKTLKIIALFLMITTIFVACDDFVEPDIDNEVVNLLAPANNLTTIQLTHTFWWDHIDGAEAYNMQIVEGTFCLQGYIKSYKLAQDPTRFYKILYRSTRLKKENSTIF